MTAVIAIDDVHVYQLGAARAQHDLGKVLPLSYGQCEYMHAISARMEVVGQPGLARSGTETWLSSPALSPSI